MKFQEREKAREAKLRLRELEIQKEELSIQLRMKELEIPLPRVRSPMGTPCKDKVAVFDVSTKHIKLVLPFQEREVDKYFLHFKRLQQVSNGPKKYGCCCYRVC